MSLYQKRFACLLGALLLAAALAVPVFAAPEDEVVTIPEPLATQDGVTTAAPEVSGETDIPTMPAVAETQAPTTAAIIPYQTDGGLNPNIMPANDDTLLMGQRDAGLFSQRNITFAALGLSCFAVLLSIIALVRSRKKAAPNATGNYQKYF